METVTPEKQVALEREFRARLVKEAEGDGQ